MAETPEERSKQTFDAWYQENIQDSNRVPETLIATYAAAIREAEERGRVQEREACAQAICAGCREGEDLYRNAHGGFMHKHNTDSAWYGCAASAIRIRFTHDIREPGPASRERLTPAK